MAVSVGEGENLVPIGEVAARSGVSERTLRYYEEIGLLCPAGHSPGGARRYGEADLRRVQHIRKLQILMGLNLEEIRRFLVEEDRLEGLHDRYRVTGDQRDQQQLLKESIQVLDNLQGQVQAKIARLKDFDAELDAKLVRYRLKLADPPSL